MKGNDKMNDYTPADCPTIYFIGVTTTQSSIMRVFPEWAKELGLKDAVIKGIDFKPHSAPEEYREAVDFIKYHPYRKKTESFAAMQRIPFPADWHWKTLFPIITGKIMTETCCFWELAEVL